jgi:Flp pilus assembly protein TadG
MKVIEPIKDQSAATSFTASGIDLGDFVMYSVQASFTGSDVAGTFKLQASNDGTNFTDISGATASVTSSGTALLNVENAGYRFVRADWTYTSGTGNITLTFIAKGHLPHTSIR